MSCDSCKNDWKCNQGRCEQREEDELQRAMGMRNNLSLLGCALPGTMQSLDGKTWTPAIAEERDGNPFNWRQIMPLPGRLTLDEWLQRRMPSDGTGFLVASYIVFGIAVGVLLAHAWARMV